jgi:hypothetical protein
MSTEQFISGLYAAGNHFLENQRPLDAVHFFRTMLLHDATDERGWIALGVCHEELGQLGIAADIYAGGALAAKTKGRCLLALSAAKRELGQEAESEEALDLARACATQEGIEDLLELSFGGQL